MSHNPYPDFAENHLNATLAQKVTDLRAIVHRANGLDGPALIALAVAYTGTQADLARQSGLTGNTVTAIRHGKRPTAAQRAAILWGITRSLGI